MRLAEQQWAIYSLSSSVYSFSSSSWLFTTESWEYAFAYIPASIGYYQ